VNHRKPGLQDRWGYVVNSLQEIIQSYEKASSRISLYEDRRMRAESVRFSTRKGELVLDLGSGPGTTSRLVASAGGVPVLLDASRSMLMASGQKNLVQGVFEYLPFRDGAFEGAVSGFALRDSHDLGKALAEVSRVLAHEGRFSFCDLGKPDSALASLAVGYYLRVVPNIVGLASTGRAGLRYGSIYDTYVLTLRNSELRSFVSRYFSEVAVHETQMGGSIVVKCQKG
jgi:demethylmenaquinone methyltransferase / 2-methoxy-6-polyprenyl-1,4-benzoquinol methylase